jgi:hypothetical protein
MLQFKAQEELYRLIFMVIFYSYGKNYVIILRFTEEVECKDEY